MKSGVFSMVNSAPFSFPALISAGSLALSLGAQSLAAGRGAHGREVRHGGGACEEGHADDREDGGHGGGPCRLGGAAAARHGASRASERHHCAARGVKGLEASRSSC